MARRKAGNVLSKDGEEARSQILHAAQKVILRFGLAKTTMEDIATEAGVSRPTVYRYFQDRTELTSVLIDWRAREVLEASRELLQREGSFEDNFIAGLIHTVALAREDPIVAMVLAPANQRGESWSETLELAAELTADLWEPFLKEARTRGEMRSDLNSSEVYTWLALVQFALFNSMESMEPSDPAHARMLKTFVLPALVAPTDGVTVRRGRPVSKNLKRQ
ncbi:TetR/AcrR family transcriptional regulator [Rhodococcus sp. IEGM 1305]|uniref:TetR/AcrR family transcriptional regulator n=1 Tax=Rhodococcus sp. IEGM 1305 TaxID=3047092 RepID=UPI0024B6E945|nr:TetR/AcrR family transcriptional regulator [Rhodococcus sp. IEGM 1305]MDI9947732.1 TetR/AcrR family transcriptional regulator [Rhodococcus sp. IEGM 1305]